MEGFLGYILLVFGAIITIFPLLWDIVKRDINTNVKKITIAGWIFISIALIGLGFSWQKTKADDNAQNKKDSTIQNLTKYSILQQSSFDSLTRLYNLLHDQAEANTNKLLSKPVKQNIINQYGIMARKISESKLMSLVLVGNQLINVCRLR
jgi:hypothetical protein